LKFSARFTGAFFTGGGSKLSERILLTAFDRDNAYFYSFYLILIINVPDLVFALSKRFGSPLYGSPFAVLIRIRIQTL
jgi:hypothetical protein